MERTRPGPLAREVRHDIGRGETDNEGTHEGARKAAQTTEHRGSKRIDNEKGQCPCAHSRADHRLNEDARKCSEE